MTDLCDKCDFEQVATRKRKQVRPDLIRTSWNIELVCQSCPERVPLVDTYSLTPCVVNQSEPTTEQQAFKVES